MCLSRCVVCASELLSLACFAPSPHWWCGFRGGRGCGERAGVRGFGASVVAPSPGLMKRRLSRLQFRESPVPPRHPAAHRKVLTAPVSTDLSQLLQSAKICAICGQTPVSEKGQWKRKWSTDYADWHRLKNSTSEGLWSRWGGSLTDETSLTQRHKTAQDSVVSSGHLNPLLHSGVLFEGMTYCGGEGAESPGYLLFRYPPEVSPQWPYPTVRR